MGFLEERMNQLVYKGENFSLAHPPKVQISKSSPVEDFVAYTFTLQEKVILSLYLGNHPSLSLQTSEGSEKETGQINGLSFESYRVKSNDGLQDKEVLIKFTSLREWPLYAHFRYSQLSAEVAQIADSIISSIQER